MSQVEPARSGRQAPSRRPFVFLVAAPALVALTLSACTGTSKPAAHRAAVASQGTTGGSQAAPDPATSSAEVAPAVITAAPAGGTSVNPAKPITVAVTAGKLTSVKLLNPEGKVVSGALAADGTSWKSTEDLGYSRTYRLSAVAVNAEGKTATKQTQFTTLTPGNMTMPYMQRPGGYSLDNGATYGVGIVPVVHFDEAITNKKAAEQALTVTTTPHATGSWNWVDDQNAHWRPQVYLASGTKVTVTAKVYGVEVGPGLYGQSDTSVSFRIGAKHVAIADDVTHLVKVYFSDKLVRTMPTSMGRGGYVQGTNGPIALWTPPGTYTVLTHENPATMSSASFGLPANSPLGYAPVKIYWSTKISVDGDYLHELDSTVWAQGHQDLSHGCLNLNHDNAQWYFQSSIVGDVVQVVHTGGPGLALWQNGDWTVPWASWVKGSALS